MKTEAKGRKGKLSVPAAMVLALVAMAGCTDADHARGLLGSQGYTEIRAGGYDFFGCGKGDEVATRFEATSPAGARVRGTVCKGWFFKNATIRYE